MNSQLKNTDLRRTLSSHAIEDAKPKTGLAKFLSNGASAVITGAHAVRKSFLEAPARNENEAEFFNAVGNGDESKLAALLARGVDPTTPSVSRIGTKYCFTPLHRAVVRNDQAATGLIASRLSPEALNLSEGEFGDTPLMMAVKIGHKDLASALLDFNADPDHPNKRGVTPFMEICRHGMTDLAAYAMAMKKEEGTLALMLYREDSNGQNSLFHSFGGLGSGADVQRLIKLHAQHGFDMNGKYGQQGYAPIHFAAFLGKGELLCHLIDTYQADTNSISNVQRFSPTMVAAFADQPEAIKLLSTYPQTYMNAARALDGNTALHVAATHHSPASAVELVNCGADLSAKNVQGQSAEELAHYLGYKDVSQLLQRLAPASTQANTASAAMISLAESALDFVRQAKMPLPRL